MLIQTCDICNGDIKPEGDWLQGNNADPIVKDGRCCDMCNYTVVIPRRLLDIANRNHKNDL